MLSQCKHSSLCRKYWTKMRYNLKFRPICRLKTLLYLENDLLEGIQNILYKLETCFLWNIMRQNRDDFNEYFSLLPDKSNTQCF